MISQNDHLIFLTDKSLFRVDELLHDSILVAKKIYSDMVIDFSFESIPENQDDLIINGNDALLKSAFFNLIKNAYQYSSNKKLQIKLSVIENSIFIKFFNVGPQLSESEAQKMFIPFFRGGNAGNKKGFGLGLSIIQRILELHYGKLTYLARANDMNEFKVQLTVT
jgi:K+-sensing histidine kinase KdpD